MKKKGWQARCGKSRDIRIKESEDVHAGTYEKRNVVPGGKL